MMVLMVGVAQLVEHQVVALRVVGSSPITHPIKIKSPCNVRVAGAFFIYNLNLAIVELAADTRKMR